jgi:iron complex transport system ATP-binding protein
LVSSSVRQMMAEDEPALESVVSGKYAMIDFWGRATRPDRVTALRLLRQVECAYLANRPWRVLSQGERQRVLIARAIMAKPRVLILDEPCAGLDPAAREQFLQFLQRLGRRKASPTLVLVTHHVEEIMPVFSHVLVLKAGRVLADGKKTATLTAGMLAQAFDARVKLKRWARRYEMSVGARNGVVI